MAGQFRKRLDKLAHAVLLNLDLASVVLSHAWDDFAGSGEETPTHTLRRWLELGSVCKTWKAAMVPLAVKLHWSEDTDSKRDQQQQQQQLVPWLIKTAIPIKELSAPRCLSAALCCKESSSFLLAKLAPALVSLHLRLFSDHTLMPPLTQLCKLQQLYAAFDQKIMPALHLDLPPSLTNLTLNTSGSVSLTDLANLSRLGSLTLVEASAYQHLDQLPPSVQTLELPISAVQDRVWCSHMQLQKLVLTQCDAGDIYLECLLHVRHIHLAGAFTLHQLLNDSSLQINTQCQDHDAVAALLTNSDIQELEVACQRVHVILGDQTVVPGLREVAMALLNRHLYEWQFVPDGTSGRSDFGLQGLEFHIRRQQPPLNLSLLHAVSAADLQPVFTGCPPVQHLMLPKLEYLQQRVLDSADFQQGSGGFLTAIHGIHLGPATPPSLQAYTALQELDGISGCPASLCLPMQLAKLRLFASQDGDGDDHFTAVGLRHLMQLQRLALYGFASYDFTAAPSPLPFLDIKTKASLPQPCDFPSGYQIGSVSLRGADVWNSTPLGRFCWSEQYCSYRMPPLGVNLADWLAIAHEVTIAANKVLLDCPTATEAAAQAILEALKRSPRASVVCVHTHYGSTEVRLTGPCGAKDSQAVDMGDIQSKALAPEFVHAVRAEFVDSDDEYMMPMLRLSRCQPHD